MSQPLIIWLPETLTGDWTWFISSQDFGVAETDSQKLGLAVKDAKAVNVILPGQWVRLLDHDLPPMKDSDRKTAIQFFIEERIAADIKGHHIVMAPNPDKRVAVISTQKMSKLMAALKQVGINPDGLYADYDCLRHELRPLVLKDRVIYPQDGYTVDLDWADSQDLKPASLDDLSPSLNINEAINLRTQTFARRSNLNIDIRQFAQAAMLIFGLGLSFLVWQGMQARALQKNANYLGAQADTLYEQATGETAPPNPALAVARAINNGDAPSADFLALSNLLFSSVSRIDGVTVETLQFDNDKNQLTLRLYYPAFESASDLERIVTGQGGGFQSGGVREFSGQLIGDAVLTSGAKS